MTISNKKEPIFLFLGDIIVLFGSLFLTLWIRYLAWPSQDLWLLHVSPFAILFFVWMTVFYIAGLYDRHTSFLRGRMNKIFVQVHLFNSFLAIAFFYLIPYFVITPKTNLFLLIIISFALLYLWRVILYSKLVIPKKHNAILVGSGPDIETMLGTINSDPQYGLYFVDFLDLSSLDLESRIGSLKKKVTGDVLIVFDYRSDMAIPVSDHFYPLLFSGAQFVDFYDIYEDMYGKVPLSLVGHRWFIEHITVSHQIYDIFKRGIDIGISVFGGLITLLLYPFIIIAIKLEDRGPVFISQERIGKNNRLIKIYKFRSMNTNEDGVWIGESTNKITKVGAFLRKYSFDELPQFWSILKGDLSLIGPRPDMVGLESRLSEEIPYYKIRYLIKPGLSGWAQITQTVIPNNIAQNIERLAYDLYYIKNRSLFLDIKIILKTLKKLIGR